MVGTHFERLTYKKEGILITFDISVWSTTRDIEQVMNKCLVNTKNKLLIPNNKSNPPMHLIY